MSLKNPIGTDKDGNEISLIDVERKVQLKQMYNRIDLCLNDREKTIIQMRYGLLDGNLRTQREIAFILGISRSYVSRIEKRALKKLNKELNNRNINM